MTHFPYFFTIYLQFGNDQKQLSVEQFVRGLSADINMLEVARFAKDGAAITEIEQSLSLGIQWLSDVFTDNLTVARECVLTAFSLTPTEKLFKQIVKLAKDSGFVAVKDEPMDGLEAEKKFGEKIDWDQDFDKVCDSFVESLNRGYSKAATKVRADTILEERKVRNLEALTSLQGDILTKAKNYNPVQTPLGTMSAKVLGLNKKLVNDLQSVIIDPRWQVRTNLYVK